jgi:hypothetical protein
MKTGKKNGKTLPWVLCLWRTETGNEVKRVERVTGHCSHAGTHFLGNRKFVIGHTELFF